MKIISKHGQKRIKERLGNRLNRQKLLKNVLRYGNLKEHFEGEFYDYLYNKSLKGAYIKIYKNFIFVISKSKKTLITTYPIPEMFLPIEKYHINSRKSKLLYFPDIFYNKNVIIQLKDKQIIKGKVRCILGNNIANELVLDSHIFINVDLIDDIFIDFDVITEELETVFCN